MHFQNVIVGCGYAGAVAARRIAEEKNESVLIVEKRSHIGGNAYDEYDDAGVLVHRYGPHIFHTQLKRAWDWLSRFTEWFRYQHRVLAFVDGMLVPLPISAETINQLYNLNLSCDEVAGWLASRGEKLPGINNSEDVVVSQAGRDIFEKFFAGYTLKQWDRPASSLDSSVIRRIPFRSTRDTRYFTDRWQGLPLHGYTRMFERILDHPNIRLMLKTDWFDLQDQVRFDRLIWTGPLDRYYGEKFGPLGWRSMRFEYETYLHRDRYQETGTINYPNDYDFVRITEFKQLTGQDTPHTTIVKDIPTADGDPYYILPDAENQQRADQYRELAAKEKNVLFVGRLAEYTYYNMDQIVDRVLGLEL